MPDQRRALVVSTGRDRGALAAVRALHRAGWFVGVGTPDGGGMPGASRACAARHVVPKPRRDGSAFLRGVQEAVLARSYDIVFGGGDDWVAALAMDRDHIPAHVVHPPAEVVTAALDKATLTEYAHRAGLPAPYTAAATEHRLASWTGPVVVKCRTHWSPGQTRAHRIDARLFPDAATARGQVAHIRQAGAEPVLQAPLRGRLEALIGVFHDGRLDARVHQVASRLWPTPLGASARAVTVPVDEELAARSEALLRELGWTGLVELQFLADENGVRHLIDLNGRFYGSMALAEAARPGLVDAWARLALGEAVEYLPDARAGLRYAWTAGDLRRARAERRGSLAVDAVDTVRWAVGARHSVWDVRDPGPAWHLATARLRGAPETGKALAESRGEERCA